MNWTRICAAPLLLGIPTMSSVALAADRQGARAYERKDDATIVVTGERAVLATASGTKTNTPLIETPQSITLIDRDELDRRNAQSIVQALDYVAGVAPNQRGTLGARYDQLAIRGFSPTIFLNGMRYQGGNYATPQTDFHLVESVDVIKGPASVLYGNAAPGGLVNVVSKLPQAEAHGAIDLSAGNFGLWRGSVDVGGPIDDAGVVRARFIGGGERSDGFARTTENERWYLSPSVSFVPDEATSLTLIGVYQRDPKSGAYGFVNPFGSVLPNPNGRLPRDFYDGDPNYERFDRKQWSVTALFRHDFGDALSYRANARYYHVEQVYRTVTGSVLLPDYRTLRRSAGGSDENFRTFTLDNSVMARFATGPFEHELLVGGDFLHNEGRNVQRFSGTDGTVPNLDIFAPAYGITIPDLVPTATPNDLKRDQVGIYAQDQLHWGGLNLIGSVRQDWYDQTSRTGSAITQLSQSKMAYRAGALYAFKFGLSPYFSWSTSFEPQSGVNLAGQPFKPVSGRQYEAGLKFQPPGTQTIITLSVYDLARQNVVVTDPDNPRNSIQVGETKTRGVELEGRGEIVRGLSFTAAATYMDAKFTRGNPIPTNVVNGAVQSGVTGTRLLGVPKWTASSFISYDMNRSSRASGPVSGLNFGAGVRYAGANDGLYSLAWNGVTTIGRFKVPGYIAVDALLGYDLGALDPRLDRVSVVVNAANLFDKRYVTTCYVANWCFYGASRTVVGSLRYRW
jgi:iron complex outermembrane receptor protein